MRKIKYKTIIQILIIVLITLFLTRNYIEKGLSHISFDNTEYQIDFVDDSGYRIKMEKSASKVISLYSAHTENLFALGLDNKIIGVGTSESYPHEALEKEVFSYKEDPEKVISARPDLVLIRPHIERSYPNFVDALKRAGLTVVSLYPDSYKEFDDYIMKLGLLTGREKKAEQLLNNYYEEIAYLEEETKDIKNKVGVYFESSDRDYKTVTLGSNADRAIAIAGGINIADDAVPIEEGSSIAAYGLEKIIEKGNEIDVFVTQRGVMGAGGNYHSISIRPGFDTIKAVKDKRVLEINQKIISSPTFRQVKGIKELMRSFYPDIYNDCSEYKYEEDMTRRDFASLTVLITQRQIFVPTSSYFRSEYRGHKYGYFEDVDEDYEDYDYIETAVIAGYLSGSKEEGLEYFYPDELITKEDLAKFIFTFGEFENLNNNIVINDIEKCENQKIVQILVDNNVFELDNGNFEPNRSLSGSKVIGILENIDW